MKKILYLVVAAMALFAVNSCKNNQNKPVISASDSLDVDEDVADTTIYGLCGEGTTMHNLQLITDAGDTLDVFIDDEDPGIVKGGLLSGDRIALIANEDQNGADGEKGQLVAQSVINLTSLLGKWASIDKNFEIIEGGTVKNNVKAEQNPWTSWKILNGKLLLNKDTFEIDNLGSDSLMLENNQGIFVFKRFSEEAENESEKQ